jgi:hypothetical protein
MSAFWPKFKPKKLCKESFKAVKKNLSRTFADTLVVWHDGFFADIHLMIRRWFEFCQFSGKT